MDGAGSKLAQHNVSERTGADTGVPVTSLTLFTYEGLWNRLWIFMQMGLAHAAMRSTKAPKPLFYKLVGSGTGVGFDPKPNWGRYGVLATWENETAARNALASHPVLTKWKARAIKTETFLLRPTRASGHWSGVEPFPVSDGQASAPLNGSIGVITRAKLKYSVLAPFWRRVPSISKQIEGADGVEFTVGIGEVPWVHQITFSVWRDERAIRDFAYGRGGAHAQAIEASRAGDWFGEDLFARFALLDHTIDQA